MVEISENADVNEKQNPEVETYKEIKPESDSDVDGAKRFIDDLFSEEIEVGKEELENLYQVDVDGKLYYYDDNDKYDSIKSGMSMSVRETHDFWDGVFATSSEDQEISEVDIQAEVYGRSEEEFEFNFDVSSTEIQNILEKFKSPFWESLSIEEQEEACKSFAQRIANILEIENLPSLEFYEADFYDCGAFIPDRNCICINRNNFDNPQEIIDTVAHETRHTYQWQHAMNSESYIDLLYAYNFMCYISPYDDGNGFVNFLDYQDQLVEAEARAFANLFILEGGKDE